jgi:hypothetical protein
MPSEPGRSGLNNSVAALSPDAWARLERILERFESAWQHGQSPALDPYLAEAGPVERPPCWWS